jgi:hypothetical protein
MSRKDVFASSVDHGAVNKSELINMYEKQTITCFTEDLFSCSTKSEGS